jgi:hypothetical protein
VLPYPSTDVLGYLYTAAARLVQSSLEDFAKHELRYPQRVTELKWPLRGWCRVRSKISPSMSFGKPQTVTEHKSARLASGC